jgi:signal transduction histidine kinase
MAVSAAVAEAGALDETLDQIACTAATLVGAKASAIYLREPDGGRVLDVVASYGLGPNFSERMNAAQPLAVGEGPGGLAIDRGEPVCIADILSSPLCVPWHAVARQERVAAMVAVPLRGKRGVVMGNLNAYRAEAGPWTAEDVNLLSLLGDHAAIAIRTAHLLDETRRQVEGLSLMVRSLRAQGHEHSNRLHAIYGLLTLGEAEEARRLIASIEQSYHSIYGQVTGRIENPTLAGFLVAEAAIALQSGIRVTLDARSRLTQLPRALDDLDAITVLGNLVHNAVDAVSEVAPARRKVKVSLTETPTTTTFRVSDWGVGIAPEDVQRIFERDYTTKPGHSGIGLSLVQSIVRRCRASIAVEHRRSGGVTITVRFGR